MTIFSIFSIFSSDGEIVTRILEVISMKYKIILKHGAAKPEVCTNVRSYGSIIL